MGRERPSTTAPPTCCGATPALYAAFAAAREAQRQLEARRLAIAAAVAAAEEARQLAERRQGIMRQLGDAAGRRAMAALDFPTAAKAALAVGGAEYLDSRPNRLQRGEHVVRYRIAGRRLECVCDDRLRITDAGICLQDHETNEKGDRYFTLESLPAVVLEAIDGDKLVVWRHG